MEEVVKCSYVNCDQIEGKEHIFNQLPVHDNKLCVKWLINSGHEDLVGKDLPTLQSMKILICNDHFSDNAYQAEKILKKDAVPLQHWEVTNSKFNDLKNDDETQQELSTVNMNISATTDSCERHAESIQMKQEMKLRETTKPLHDKDCINEWCRTCATKKPDLVNMTAKDKSAEMDLLAKLKLLIEIDDEDRLPLHMCLECVIKLEQSYRFFQQIYVADNALRQIFPVSKTNICTACNSKVDEGVLIDAEGNEHSTTFLDDINCNNHNESFTNLCSTNGIGSRSTSRIEHNENNKKDENCYTLKGNLSKKYKCKAETSENNTSCTATICTNEQVENTVDSLLTETCHSDEELDWFDVVKAIEQQNTSSLLTHPSIPKIQIRCEYCNSVFRLRRQLKTHLVVNHFKQIYNMCDDCNICCDSKSQLVKHRALVHNEKKYQCDHCKKMFYRKKNLRLHIENVHSMELYSESINSKYYTCDICDEKYISKQFLENHIHSVHSSILHARPANNRMTLEKTVVQKDTSIHENSLIFPCLVCGRVFCNEKKLESHTEVHRSESSPKRKRMLYHCKLCSTSFMLGEQLRMHVKSHTVEDWEAYRNKILHCGECSAKLIGNEKFRIHKMKYHLAKQRDFICLLCDEADKGLKTLEDYERHINLHCIQLKRSASHRYKCEYCNDVLMSNSHLLNHIDSFHSDAMHTCPTCGLKVKRKQNLKDHMYRVHDSKKKQGNDEIYASEIRYPCRICGKELLTLNQRRNHENDHEKPIKELEKLFPWTQKYTCNHCNKKFWYIHKLRQHLLDTHGDLKKVAIIKTIERNRRYKCSKCQATFKYKSGLYMHTKSVHSNITHSCPLCGVKCKLVSGLKKHLLKHENERKFKHDTSIQHTEYRHCTNEQKSGNISSNSNG